MKILTNASVFELRLQFLYEVVHAIDEDDCVVESELETGLHSILCFILRYNSVGVQWLVLVRLIVVRRLLRHWLLVDVRLQWITRLDVLGGHLALCNRYT